MSNNKLDKTTVVTAFVCAIATFACGFAFCLALLSGTGSCYFLVKDFMRSTRGYALFDELKTYIGSGFSEIVEIFVLLVVVFLALLFLIRVIFVRKQNEYKNIEKQPYLKVENTPVLPKVNIENRFVDEAEVASVLRSCHRNPEASSWRKLNSLNAGVLARYLKNECPQVVAIVMSMLEPKQCADVLSLFNDSFAAEVIGKMVNSHPADNDLVGAIGKTIADNIEDEKDMLPHISKIFGYFDGATENRILSALEMHNEDVANNLKKTFITFEDTLLLSQNDMQDLVSKINEASLVIALRGASEQARTHFYNAMPSRQAEIIREALLRLGPIKLKDIEKAQQEIVNICKRMYGDTLRGR